MGKVNQLDEVVFESLYLDFKRVFGLYKDRLTRVD